LLFVFPEISTMADKHNKHNPRSRGLTLLEIIMVLVIMGIIAAFAGGPIVHTLDLWLNKTRGHTDRAELHFALERMSQEVREARKIMECRQDYLRVLTPPGPPSEYEIDGRELLLNGNIIFRTPSPEETPSFFCYESENQDFVTLELSIQKQDEEDYSVETRIYRRN